jgi:sorting nexin-4
MLGEDEDVFDSITWESPSAPPYTVDERPATTPGFRQSTVDSSDDIKWEGYLIPSVKDPVKELAETKDAYVSYLVSAKVWLIVSCWRCSIDHISQTNLNIFSTPTPSARRRFQDFVFLRENLAKDFPACVVPALPGKHRMGPCLCRTICADINHTFQSISQGTDSVPSSWSAAECSMWQLTTSRV